MTWLHDYKMNWNLCGPITTLTTIKLSLHVSIYWDDLRNWGQNII